MRKRFVAGIAVVLGVGAGIGFAVWQGHGAVSRRVVAPVATTMPAPVLAPRADAKLGIAWLPATVTRFEEALVGAALVHQVDPEMLAIVTLVESGGWVGAKSPTGAVGLMQVMPATGQAIADERALAHHAEHKLGDAGYNIDFGAWYLARMLQRFRTDDLQETIGLAASAYNGGPTRLAKHLEGKAELSDQTKRYRHWVADMWAERREARSATFDEWLAAGGSRLVAEAASEMARNP